MFRSGDIVKHIPTGETWVLAYGNEREVGPCGWPETLAYPKDCELIKAATDEEYQKMVDSWADKDGTDLRILRCRSLKKTLTNQGNYE